MVDIGPSAEISCRHCNGGIIEVREPFDEAFPSVHTQKSIRNQPGDENDTPHHLCICLICAEDKISHFLG